MTAAPTPRAAQGAVPARKDTTERPAGSDDWAARTVIDQYSPGHQFVAH